MEFIDYLSAGASGLARRQTPECVLDSSTFGQDVLHGCNATDYNCLCDQTTSPTFSDWVLDTICNTCDGQRKIVIDPLAALGTYCPVQSQIRVATYSCSNYTPAPTQISTITPSLVLPTSSSTSVDTAAITSHTLLAPVPVSSTTSAPAPSTPSPTTAPPPTISSTSSSTPSISSSSIVPILAPAPSGQSSAVTTSLRSSLTSVSDLTTTTASRPATSSLTTDAASASSTPGASPLLTVHDKGGLSTGAKAGIGIAAALLPIIILLLAFFCWRRRRKNRKQVWEAGSSEILPELYTENGTLAAFEAAALNGNGNGHSQMSPIREKTVGGLDHGVREIFLDNPNESEDDIRRSRIGLAVSPEPDSHPGDRASRIGLATSPSPPLSPPPKNAQRYAVTRKELPSPSSLPGYSSPTTSYDAYGGRDSQMSGILRGPVSDMYQYGNEAIESDEALARLEEEERRIDEAIRESERLALMREEREAVRARIEEVRKSGVGGRPDI